MRNLRAFLGVALTLLLGAMLIATIYFTMFDLEWIAFLSGVLFAAIAATTRSRSCGELASTTPRASASADRSRCAIARKSKNSGSDVCLSVRGNFVAPAHA